MSSCPGLCDHADVGSGHSGGDGLWFPARAGALQGRWREEADPGRDRRTMRSRRFVERGFCPSPELHPLAATSAHACSSLPWSPGVPAAARHHSAVPARHAARHHPLLEAAAGGRSGRGRGRRRRRGADDRGRGRRRGQAAATAVISWWRERGGCGSGQWQRSSCFCGARRGRAPSETGSVGRICWRCRCGPEMMWVDGGRSRYSESTAGKGEEEREGIATKYRTHRSVFWS